jgi:hypothetical protein
MNYSIEVKSSVAPVYWDYVAVPHGNVSDLLEATAL